MPEETASKTLRRRLVTRRGLLRAFAGAGLAGAATYGYGSTVAVHQLVTEHVTIAITGLAPYWHNRRIVQLSDLHAGRTSLDHIRHAFEVAVSLKPETIVITGDFVDNSHVDPGPLCEALRAVTSKIETIGITGNHDFSHNFNDFTFVNFVCDALGRAGVRMLRNDWHQPRFGPGEVCFVGVEDYWSGLLRADVLRLARPDASVIALSHNPDSYELMDNFRFHLMLSGHTHGGQVRIPFLGAPIVPVKHKERAAGLFHLSPEHPERALYVSRGVGHILKIRLFCPPEVTCFTLQNPAMA